MDLGGVLRRVYFLYFNDMGYNNYDDGVRVCNWFVCFGSYEMKMKIRKRFRPL